MTISILMDICIICEFWNTGGFNRKRKKTLHLIILDFIYRVLKLSHNNTIRIWFLPDFARWWIPSQAMTKTVGTLGPRSRYVYTISTCLMPGMSSNFPRPLLLWLHKKKLFCFILQLQSFFPRHNDTFWSLCICWHSIIGHNFTFKMNRYNYCSDILSPVYVLHYL